jgi:hypothetical protein
MKTYWLRSTSCWIVTLLAVLILQSYTCAQDFEDPPSRVARLSFVRGAISFQPAGTEDWVEATVNRPMTTGDTLWSDRGSRAALHIGSASINLSENTGFSFLNLTDDVAQLQLSVGTLRIRVKRLRDNENFEVDTPNLAFTVLRPGIYKISVNDAGDTTVIEDRSGEGEVTGGGSAYTVHAGDLATFAGTDQLSADIEDLGDQEDDFEQWCRQRDHHEDISLSARYVSDDAIGYDDLDDNGGWRPVPDYGMVWFPHSTLIGWAPYHYGHWAYIPPWGYTWVDDAPWGFAPFHYGRWIVVGNTWGWVPCPPRPPDYGQVVYVAPVYAPALVAWVGGAEFGAGEGVGWFPLGPREVYVPAYPVSRTYVNNVNITNTTVNTTVVNNYYTTVIVNKTVNVTNVTYVNQRVPGAVAATTSQAFSSGQPVAKNAVQVNARAMTSAHVNALTPAAVPQRQAVLGGRPAATVKPPAAIQKRAVVAKTPPPPPPPSFEKRQEAIKSNGGRPLSLAQVRQIAPVRTQAAAAPQVRVAPAAKPATPQIVRGKPAASQPKENSASRPGNEPAPGNANRPEPRPANSQPQNAGRPAPPPAATVQHPPTARPMNEQLEKQHQQQSVELNKQQDQERQQLEQKQREENQQLQKQKADEAQKEQALQQHQQQLQELQKQHEQQQKALQQKQEEEHKQAEQQPSKEKPQPAPKGERPEQK